LNLTASPIIDVSSQGHLESVYVQGSAFDELDLSSSNNLTKLSVQYSNIRKFNLKSGGNQSLVAFYHHTMYVDACFLIDDINNPPPAFATAKFRDNDVITDDQAVYDAY